MDWRIGCSGFYYKEWKEIFYPAKLPQKQWFEYYCQHFNTIEINSSFYKQPSPKSFAAWYQTSPPDFLFTIKAPRTITHYGKFNHTKELSADFYDVASEGLKEKLGCVLFQMPPSLSYTEERLNLILENLDKRFNNVIEARHLSWWDPTVIQELKKHRISFSGISYPSALPEDIIQDNDPVYYRFHGKPVLYKSQYPEEQLRDFVSQVNQHKKRIYVYFNNTWGNAALINARQLIALT